jgi:hypothetical protein
MKSVYRKLGRSIVSASGFVLVGIGIYFIFFRPIFLPEDLTYLKSQQLPEVLIPRLSLWLQRVFIVLGGFAVSTGTLTIIAERSPRTKLMSLGLLCAWFTSIGIMTLVNFTINSAFRWALLIFALIWLAGIMSSWNRTT